MGGYLGRSYGDCRGRCRSAGLRAMCAFVLLVGIYGSCLASSAGAADLTVYAANALYHSPSLGTTGVLTCTFRVGERQPDWWTGNTAIVGFYGGTDCTSGVSASGSASFVLGTGTGPVVASGNSFSSSGQNFFSYGEYQKSSLALGRVFYDVTLTLAGSGDEWTQAEDTTNATCGGVFTQTLHCVFSTPPATSVAGEEDTEEPQALVGDLADKGLAPGLCVADSGGGSAFDLADGVGAVAPASATDCANSSNSGTTYYKTRGPQTEAAAGNYNHKTATIMHVIKCKPTGGSGACDYWTWEADSQGRVIRPYYYVGSGEGYAGGSHSRVAGRALCNVDSPNWEYEDTDCYYRYG
jgi:hypothetical protein